MQRLGIRKADNPVGVSSLYRAEFALWLALIVGGSVAHAPAASMQPTGCVSESGTGGACADGTALDGATGVTVSPDGSTVYVASETSRAVSVFPRDPATGAINQLPGTDGCVSDSGTGGACADGVALVGPRSVALSPDGTSFYFPATTSAAVAVFSREQATGRLAQLAGTDGCVSETGTAGECADGVALEGARSAAVSADGKNIYVASFFSDAAAVFTRDLTLGTITQLVGGAGCISETGTGGACADGVALDGARSVAVSPDDKNVYLASETSGAVSVFSRDDLTGAITQLAGMSGCLSQTGTDGGCTDVRALGGAGGIALSPNGDNVYVASLSSDAVAVFSRDQTTGVLSQLPGTAGCVSETGNGGSCADGRALDRSRSVTVSPDGANVYVAAENGDAVAVFSRDPATGRLTQLSGRPGCVSETGSGGECTDGTALDGVRSVAVTPDGKNVYTASFYSSAVAIFSRDETTGALTQLGNANEFPPVITSDGGGASAALARPENQTAVTDVDASDGDGTVPTYSIAGGLDAARFTIVPATGVLTFVTAPNFEAPTDTGANNVYDVVVSASDGSNVDTQAISVTVTNVVESGGSPLFFSLLAAGSVGGVSAANEDIVFFDGAGFALAFDGSDVGLAGLRIDAFSWVDATSLLLSFDTAGSFPGIAGTVDDSDLIRFNATSLGAATAGSFSLYFDGSDVGLTTSGEDVDAVELLPGGHVLVSTIDTVSATGAAGEDEDLLEFAPNTLGPVTSGSFSLYFDGSDVLLTTSGEDVDAAARDSSGKLYLSTLNNFAVPGISGADEDVFVFTPASLGNATAGAYSSTPYFDGSAFRLEANDVFAIDLP